MPITYWDCLGSIHMLTSDPAACYCTWEATEGSPSTWTVAIHVGDSDAIADSSVQLDTALAKLGNQEMNQKMNILSHSVSPPTSSTPVLPHP